MDINILIVVKQSFLLLSYFVLLVGILFLIIPNYVIGKLKQVDKWIATDSIFNVINRPRSSEKKLYRHNKLFALILFIASVYILYMLTMVMNVESFVNFLTSDLITQRLADWLAQAIIYVLIFFNILALLLSLVLFIRPSALKDLEQLSNTWFKSESKFGFLDTTIDVTNGSLTAFKLRIIGIFTILGCVYIIYIIS
jgi:hypothetical protein